MTIQHDDLGTHAGEAVSAFTITNSNGLTARIFSYGAILAEMHVPDRNGRFADVALGLPDIASYAGSRLYMGAICGRYANRIRAGRYHWRGETIQLTQNEAQNHLHGGTYGLSFRNWTPRAEEGGDTVTLTYLSRAGEEGYPGNLQLELRYHLSTDNELVLDMQARTDAATVINLAHHGYWNMAGHDSGPVDQQVLSIAAGRYTPVDSELLPTGEFAPVAQTRFDLRRQRPLGTVLGSEGLDINYWLDGTGGDVHRAATLYDPVSGRVLEIITDQPGLQVYSGEAIGPGLAAKSGAVYGPRAGIALEAQKFPDGPNHPNFPDTHLAANETYRQRTVYRFLTR